MNDPVKVLVEKYDEVKRMLEISQDSNSGVHSYIRKVLSSFMSDHKRVALYCYGVHTKMLFTDFVSELRDIVCIIDNGVVSSTGFTIIRDGEIDSYELDGIIVSSFRYKEEIKKLLNEKHKGIDVLDIYEKLEEEGICLNSEFYCGGPYHNYVLINRIKKQLNDVETKSDKDRIKKLREMLQIYVRMKDFRMAKEVCSQILLINEVVEYRKIYNLLTELYKLQLQIVADSSEQNLIMLCLDGMRYQDFDNEELKLTKYLKGVGRFYTSAYSYSTMTYESLVPVFSENSDQKTEYYLKDEVDAKDCRFMRKAFKQNRFIAVYGDGNRYISDNRIKYSGEAQGITEKLWDFTLDIGSTNNGLFYLHELYESHFSFSNPYTEEKLVAIGTAMLFDYLPKNGGQLQTDYVKQLNDSIRYLDDTLTPFITRLPGSLILFADHGNMVLDKDTNLTDITKIRLVASDEWIHIPLVIVTNDIEAEEDNDIVSLMDMNDIVISLLEGNRLNRKKRRYIKIGRSSIYNPDFLSLYEMMGTNYRGDNFEGFIFDDGYKLIVYSNGFKELYRTEDDCLINEKDMIKDRFNEVAKEITIL